MMTKWDSIQEYIRPVEPKFWGDELDLEEKENELSLDEIIEQEEELLNEMENN